LPKELNWDDFNALTNRVKYNWEESKFDAAVGAFMHNGQLHEFVRVYSNKLTKEYLEALRKLYLEKLK
jgi:pantothenate kinase-related protein Tda10